MTNPLPNTAPTFPVASGIQTMTFVVQTNANYVTSRLLPITGTGGSSVIMKNITSFFEDIQRGVWKSNLTVIQGGVNATGTALFASVVATNTLVIGGVTLTAVASGATSVQFNVGSSDTETASNAVTAINALTTINKVVQATSSGATITITSLIPGTIGNLITLSTNSAGTITVGASLSGGTDGSKGVIAHGL